MMNPYQQDKNKRRTDLRRLLSQVSLFTRRHFLLSLGFLSLAFKPSQVTGRVRGNPQGKSENKEALLQNLEAYINVLIPADSTPSAGDLNIHHQIIQQAEAVQDYPLLLQQGCLWLESRAQQQWYTSFHQLDSLNQQSIVEEAFASPSKTLARVFSEWVRKDAMTLFYGNPESWPGLPLSRAPQPLGFMDTHEKPVSIT